MFINILVALCLSQFISSATLSDRTERDVERNANNNEDRTISNPSTFELDINSLLRVNEKSLKKLTELLKKSDCHYSAGHPSSVTCG